MILYDTISYHMVSYDIWYNNLSWYMLWYDVWFKCRAFQCRAFQCRSPRACVTIIYHPFCFISHRPSASKLRRQRDIETKQRLFQAAQAVQPLQVLGSQLARAMLTASVDWLIMFLTGQQFNVQEDITTEAAHVATCHSTCDRPEESQPCMEDSTVLERDDVEDRARNLTSDTVSSQDVDSAC